MGWSLFGRGMRCGKVVSPRGRRSLGRALCKMTAMPTSSTSFPVQHLMYPHLQPLLTLRSQKRPSSNEPHQLPTPRQCPPQPRNDAHRPRHPSHLV